jgi:CRP/FNR family transcriptional regulator, nitrogen oxide reductase regulator
MSEAKRFFYNAPKFNCFSCDCSELYPEHSSSKMEEVYMPEGRQKNPIAKVSELFADVPGSVCKEILALARPRDFISRDVIFSAGAPAKEIFLLTSGRVKITQVSQNGNEVILRLDLPGDVMGALALEPEGTHSSTAQAIQDCRTVAWDATTFEAVLERFPILRRNTERILERRICQLERRLCEVSTATVAPRLAHTLVRLIGQVGYKSNGHLEIDLQQELVAQMTAMTPFTVSRMLSRWEEQGLVSLRRGAIVVRDYKALLDLSKGRKIPRA